MSEPVPTRAPDERETPAQREIREAAEEGRGVGRTPYEQTLADEGQAEAVAEIPNPGPVDEPEPQHQAHHTEQTDPPEGPYPDPPTGPYPDPAIKDPPSEEQVFSGRQTSRASGRTSSRTPAGVRSPEPAQHATGGSAPHG